MFILLLFNIGYSILSLLIDQLKPLPNYFLFALGRWG